MQTMRLMADGAMPSKAFSLTTIHLDSWDWKMLNSGNKRVFEIFFFPA
jgi:hypothetical protein